MIKKAINCLSKYCYDRLERIEYIDSDAIELCFVKLDEAGEYVTYTISFFSNGDYSFTVNRESTDMIFKEDMVFVAMVIDSLGEVIYE